MKKNDWDEDIVYSMYSGSQDPSNVRDAQSKSHQFVSDGFEVTPSIVVSPTYHRRVRIKDDRSTGSGTINTAPYAGNQATLWEEDERKSYQDDVSQLTYNSISKERPKSPRSPYQGNSQQLPNDDSDEALVRAANSLSIMSSFATRSRNLDAQDKLLSTDNEILHTEYRADEDGKKDNVDSLLENFLMLKNRIEQKEKDDYNQELENDMDNYDDMLDLLDELAAKEQDSTFQAENFQADKNKWLVNHKAILNNFNKQEVKATGKTFVIANADYIHLPPKSSHTDGDKPDYKVVRHQKGLEIGDDIEPDYKAKHKQKVLSPKSILKSPKYSPINPRSSEDSHFSLAKVYPKIALSEYEQENQKKEKAPKSKLFKFFSRKSKSKDLPKQSNSYLGINSTDKDSIDLKYVQPIIAYNHKQENTSANSGKSGPNLLPRINVIPNNKPTSFASNSFFIFAAYSMSSKALKPDLLPSFDNQDDASVAAYSTSHSIVSALTQYESDEEDEMNLTISSPKPYEEGSVMLFAVLLKRSCRQSFNKWNEESKKNGSTFTQTHKFT